MRIIILLIGLAFLPYFSGKAVAQGEMVNIPGEKYSMDKYEVTQGEYEKVMRKNPSKFKGSNLPVEQVTWYEANDYCRKVGKHLPAEWEWERAAKAGTSTKYYWGDNEDDAGDYAWYEKNSDGTTHPVGQKKPNRFGLYDMTGNVWEWTASNSGKYKNLRGGSWFFPTYGMRSAYSITYDPSYNQDSVGFRCAQ